jgi:hypothetical protein
MNSYNVEDGLEKDAKVSIRFQCPRCGGRSLMEMLDNYFSGREVAGISEDDKIIYQPPRRDGYSERWFKCRDCHQELDQDRYGPIFRDEHLIEWFKKHGS